MPQIVLTSDQDEILATAREPIPICRPDGSVAGFVSPIERVATPKEPLFTPEEIAEAERRIDSPGPWYTTKEVLDGLGSQTQS